MLFVAATPYEDVLFVSDKRCLLSKIGKTLQEVVEMTAAIVLF